MTESYDLCVIGAGAAGLAAANTCARLGLRTLLLDERPNLGGQIFRGLDHGPFAGDHRLGRDYSSGQTLLTEFQASGAQYQPRATVWRVERDCTVHTTIGHHYRMIRARRLIIATGAMERPLPFPGWTLPGVMNAGAAQIMLKESGVALAAPFVLAGKGPLLYLLAWQYVRLGHRPAALIALDHGGKRLRNVRRLSRGFADWHSLAKGLMFIRAIRKARIPIYRRSRELVAFGDGKLARVGFVSGRRRIELGANALLIHDGLVPNVQVTQSLNCAHRWNARQATFEPALDSWGETDAPGIFAVGDCGGILGARSAQATGTIAGLRVAEQLGRLSDTAANDQARPHRAIVQRQRSLRDCLDELYPPQTAQLLLGQQETVLCRCEEVTVGSILSAVADGAHGPNQIKSYTRCGMGPCQGRTCGSLLTNLLAHILHKPQGEIGGFQARTPLKPVPLSLMAEWPDR